MKGLVVVALFAVVSPAHAEPSFTVLPLSRIASGLAISGDGTTVAGWTADFNNQGFRWSEAGGAEALGTLIAPSGASFASGVSADGSVVVGAASSAPPIFPDPPSFDRAFHWTPAEGMVELGDLPGGTVYAQAGDISADGTVIVGQSRSESGLEAFLWKAEQGMVGLGDLPGGAFGSNARATSSDGSMVVGRSLVTATNGEAFLWTAEEGMVGLDAAGEFSDSGANAVSADGSVVVGTALHTSGGGWQVFRWSEATGMVPLGDLPGGRSEGYGFGVSGDGSTIVGRSYSADGLRAFIWDEIHGMRQLDHVLTDLGIDLTGWKLTSAEGISTDGNSIVGYGTDPDGDVRAWVAVIPEPEHATMLLSGALALAFLHRRRDHLRITT